MTRVSLKEAYDNKDVVAQIYAIRDIAEGAEDTANNAVSTANVASEHVDALVPQVEGAVQNANNASASAQASAQTVAGYDTRLVAVEEADTQNVKLDGAQTITGQKTFSKDIFLLPTPAVALPSNAVVTKGYVESTDGVTNNLVHRSANETINGVKEFASQIKLANNSWRFDCTFPELDNANPIASTGYIRIGAGAGSTYEIGRIQYSIRDNGNRYFALYLVDKNGGYHSKVLFEIDNDGNVVV